MRLTKFEGNVKCYPNLGLLSVKKFNEVDDSDRILINNVIEKNYLLPASLDAFERGGYNFSINEDDTLFFPSLYEKFRILCVELFGDFKIAKNNEVMCYVYRSNKDDCASVLHDHSCKSTITGVYYYQVDNDGIIFESNGKTCNYLPEQDELIIFPSKLKHKPAFTKSASWRYSVNMGILTEEPSSKLFNKYSNGFSKGNS